MPLHHGRHVKTIKSATSANISMEMKRGHGPGGRGFPHKQAIAIALANARKDALKAHIKPASVSAGRRRK